jgi:hypothetical protein
VSLGSHGNRNGAFQTETFWVVNDNVVVLLKGKFAFFNYAQVNDVLHEPAKESCLSVVIMWP